MPIIDKIQLSGTVYTIGSETTTAVTSASTDNEIPTAKAVYDALQEGGGGVNVVQTTGTSTTDVMSQDAVTTQLNGKADKSKVGSGLGVLSTNNHEIVQLISQSGTYITGFYNEMGFGRINNRPIVKQGTSSYENFSLVDTSAITTSVTSASTDTQVPSAKAVYDQLGGLKLVKLTQSEYDALETKDNSTLYVING